MRGGGGGQTIAPEKCGMDQPEWVFVVDARITATFSLRRLTAKSKTHKEAGNIKDGFSVIHKKKKRQKRSS